METKKRKRKKLEEKGRDRNQKLIIKVSSVKMKHTKCCQFHESIGNDYSSECNRNPANIRNLKIAETDQRSTRGHNKQSTRRKQYPHAGKPEASKIYRKVITLFSSSEDEKEYTPELVTFKEEEQKEY